MNQPTLVVLAAGIGSRYGGLKQMDPIGPAGETIIDYSIYDAIRAGFGRVVFVIRHEIEADFKAVFGQKFEQRLPVMYAYQELEKIPVGFAVPPQRKKPWGTGHAVLMAEGLTEGNFAVINADDFYGAVSFQRLAAYLQTAEDAGKADYTMVGFILRNTLSDFGSVARGVCHQNEQGFLEHVVELTKIERAGDQAQYTDENGQVHPLSGAKIVSMNMWGFTPSLFAYLRQQFATFMVERGLEEKSEFFLPSVVNTLIAADQTQVKVLSSSDAWFGITYQQDRPHVIEKIQALVAQGVYPAKLWT